MSLPKDQILQCAPGAEVRVVSGTELRVTFRSSQIRGSEYTLRVLDAFRQPTTMGLVVERFRSSGLDTKQWVELTGCILQLHEAGVLVDPAATAPVVRSHGGRFDSYPVHIRMLNDRERTERYQQAIRAVVRPGDVVVDIGTGSGVLAATAAQAGAARVYAIERTEMAKLARRLFEANGLAERISVIQAQSTEVELPERADVLVSEIIGNDPLCEDIVAVTNDALRRLLKPSARVIPAGLRLFAQPFTAPADVVRKTVIDAAMADDWRERYAIDFSPLLDGSSVHNHEARVSAWKTRQWLALGNAVELADLDLSKPGPVTVQTTGRFQADRDGALNAVLLYFAAQLAPGIELSTAPASATPTDHWSSVVWMPGTPLSVRGGDVIPFSYRYAMTGSELELLA